MPATIRDILRTLTADPGRPRLTWYGPAGERIELSGAVLANWVSKTTNLLVEEFDAEAGTTVDLDLPPHWRTLVWALAAWQTGAEVRVVDAPGQVAAPADIVVTATPSAWLGPDGRRPAHGDLVVVSLPALARRYDGDLPAGAVDAASAVMTYADSLGYVTPVDPAAAALSWTASDGGSHGIDHDGLLAWAVGAAGTPRSRSRALVRTVASTTGTVDLFRAALREWSADGSVVVLEHELARSLETDPGRVARLVATERVDRDAGPTG